MKEISQLILGAVVAGHAVVAQAADLAVVAVEPAARSLRARADEPIVVRFDKPVLPSSVVVLQSFWAFGRWSGTSTGTLGFSDGDRTVTFTPDRPFSAGENVMVILSHDIEAADGTTLRPGGYSFQFWTWVKWTPMNFAQVQELSTRSAPDQRSQAYGGFASDLNGDGWLDLAIVNEITADLRVYLNRADQSGTFDSFLTPPFPLEHRASPNEPHDFNRDGIVDVCIANIGHNSVSILLGNGDGTFAPQQNITVGLAPRGIAVLDVDGDGDVDIVNTNADSDNLSLMLNDGTGTFGAPIFFDGGIVREWALAAADMNNDGLLDLVVAGNTATISERKVSILTSNGDGTFTVASTQNSDGRSWMLNCGDLNGDGAEDVAVVNGSSGRAAILLGDGAGNLGPPQRYPTDPFVIATDLGDLDGDGDLDWITSSYSGDWYLYRNRGDGKFTLDRTFPAPAAASCGLMFDADNDSDLDLALIDEIADVVLVMKNSGTKPIPAVDAWGLVVLALLVTIAASLRVRHRAAAGTR